MGSAGVWVMSSDWALRAGGEEVLADRVRHWVGTGGGWGAVWVCGVGWMQCS